MEVAVRGPTGGREVTATGLGLYQSCVGKVTSFTIETLGRSGKEFDVVISGPHGNAVPVRCYQHRDGNLLAEFTTNAIGMRALIVQHFRGKDRERWIIVIFRIAGFPGTYKIDVLQGAKPVLGSPFFCQAFDASKVRIQELGPTTVSVHDHIAFKRELSEDVTFCLVKGCIYFYLFFFVESIEMSSFLEVLKNVFGLDKVWEINIE